MQWNDKIVKIFVLRFGTFVLNKAISQVRDEIEYILNNSQDIKRDLKSWLDFDEFIIKIPKEEFKKFEDENT